jgi:hypothetical protein
MSDPIQIEITATAVAWYGAIVATISGIVSALNFFRDRAKVKIQYQRDMIVVGKSVYSPDKTYFNITVINNGRRPVNITKAALRTLSGKKKFAVLSDSFSDHRKRILTEESPVCEFLMEQDENLLKGAWYISVYDAAGNVYKKYMHRLPLLWYLWYRIRH